MASFQWMKENSEPKNSVACEEVREEESAGSPVYGGPREWVLTATLTEAAPGPVTRRREIGGREDGNLHGRKGKDVCIDLTGSNLRQNAGGSKRGRERGACKVGGALFY
jgi:hypothetical protein